MDLITIGQISLLIPLVTMLVKWRKLPDGKLWIILLLGVWLLAEIVLYVTATNGIRNLWVLYILTPVQLFILMQFFIGLYPIKKSLIKTLFVLGIVLNCIEFVFRPNELNSFSQLYQCLLITIVSIFLLFVLVKQNMSLKWNWVIGGITFFFMGSAIYFVAFLSMDNLTLLQFLSDTHSFRLILTYTIMTFGLWKLSY